MEKDELMQKLYDIVMPRGELTFTTQDEDIGLMAKFILANFVSREEHDKIVADLQTIITLVMQGHRS